MKHKLPFVFVCICANLFFISVTAQNLVLNPSFENINGSCGLSGYTSLMNWYNPDPTDSCSTPDWFATCQLSFSPTHAPNSWLGNQAPHTGTGYAGAILYDLTTPNYREYVAGELSSALTAGQSYCVTMYVSLADDAPIAVNKLGIYFSNSPLQFTWDNCANPAPLPYTPQCQATSTITDKTNWVQLQWNYTATGGEKYLTIGNFYNNTNSTTTSVTGGNPLAAPFAYYFFDDVSVTPGPCPSFTASINPANTTCGGCNGSVTANPANGVAPYRYLWSANAGNATTQTVNNLCSGSYTVTITDTTGATVTMSSSISTSSGITLTPSSSGTTCGGGNGSATVSASGGSGYTYGWSNGGTAATIGNIVAGNYTVTVTGGGCSATSSASVATSSALTLSTPVVSSASCGQPNGSASVTATNGTAPFTYHWNNGSTTSSITGLNSGTYTVTVTATGGCTATASAVIDSTAGITLSASGTRAGCVASGIGSVTVLTGTGPFTYLWSNGATTANLTNLSAGNYTVTVTGASSCTATTTMTVANTGTGVTVNAASVAASCGGNTGSVSLNITTGNGPFTYLWSNGATTDTIGGLAVGNYTVTVTSHDGCSATAAATVSSSGTAPNITMGATGTTCGNANGSATVTAVGGTYTYLWSNGATTATISNIASGTYTVTVQDGTGCSTTGSAVVNPSGTTVSIQASANAICQGDTSQVCAPAGFQTYLWSNGQTGQCVNATAAGNYYVTVTDNGNCTATSNHVSITVNTPVAVTITQHGDTLKASSASSYQWYNGNTAIAGATSSVYIFTQDGTYTVKGTDANGCTSTSNAEVIKGVLGVLEVTSDANIRVYPNPLSNESWHVEVSDNWVGSNCDIMDATGRVIYHTQLKDTHSELDLNVAQGIYLMRINLNQKNYTVKLIKL